MAAMAAIGVAQQPIIATEGSNKDIVTTGRVTHYTLQADRGQ